jgi:hypothetical protein
MEGGQDIKSGKVINAFGNEARLEAKNSGVEKLTLETAAAGLYYGIEQ